MKYSRHLLAVTLVCGSLLACTGGEKMESVEPQNVSLQNSPVIPGYPEGANITANADKFCLWNDKKYSDGASVCDSRIRYKCWGDKWVEVGQCKS